MYQKSLLVLGWNGLELCEVYQLKDIWNMDESGCFFKALPSKDLAQKGKKM